MHRSIIKLFLVSSLFFGLVKMPLVAMVHTNDIDVEGLELCYQELSQELVPFKQNPAVDDGLHSLSDIIVWLKQDTRYAPRRPLAEDLCMTRASFCNIAMHQNSLGQTVSSNISRALALLKPLFVPLLIMVPVVVAPSPYYSPIGFFEQKKVGPKKALVEAVVAQENKNWSPLTGSYIDLSECIKSIRDARREQKAPKKVRIPSQQEATPSETTMQVRFIPIHKAVAPASPVTSERGSVKPQKKCYGRDFCVWSPESPKSPAPTYSRIKSNERYPGYINGDVE